MHLERLRVCFVDFGAIQPKPQYIPSSLIKIPNSFKTSFNESWNALLEKFESFVVLALRTCERIQFSHVLTRKPVQPSSSIHPWICPFVGCCRDDHVITSSFFYVIERGLR